MTEDAALVPVSIDPVTGDVFEQRPFPYHAIQQSIDDALASIPEGRTSVFFVYADLEAVKIGVAGRLGDKWSWCGDLEKRYQGHYTGKVEVRFTPW